MFSDPSNVHWQKLKHKIHKSIKHVHCAEILIDPVIWKPQENPKMFSTLSQSRLLFILQCQPRSLCCKQNENLEKIFRVIVHKRFVCCSVCGVFSKIIFSWLMISHQKSTFFSFSLTPSLSHSLCHHEKPSDNFR